MKRAITDAAVDVHGDASYRASWRRALLLFIPAGLAAVGGNVLLAALTGGDWTFDAVAYPAMALALVVVGIVVAFSVRSVWSVMLVLTGGVGAFLSCKLAFMLFGGLPPERVVAELTESFFWAPAVYLLAFTLPGRRVGTLLSTTFTCSVLAVSVGHFALDPGGETSVSLAHALLQLNIANVMFLGIAHAFIRFKEEHARTRSRLEAAERLAGLDPLTELPNRRGLHDRLSAMLAEAGPRERKVALLFVDVDGLKRVNDVHGHEAGDVLLQAFAERLRATVRKSDVVARISGDEFVLALDGVGEDRDAAAVARALLDRCSRPFEVGGQDVTMSASIGIALFPDDGATSQALLRNADAAMYRVKRAGKNGVGRYEPGVVGEVSSSGDDGRSSSPLGSPSPSPDPSLP